MNNCTNPVQWGWLHKSPDCLRILVHNSKVGRVVSIYKSSVQSLNKINYGNNHLSSFCDSQRLSLDEVFNPERMIKLSKISYTQKALSIYNTLTWLDVENTPKYFVTRNACSVCTYSNEISHLPLVCLDMIKHFTWTNKGYVDTIHTRSKWWLFLIVLNITTRI